MAKENIKNDKFKTPRVGKYFIPCLYYTFRNAVRDWLLCVSVVKFF